MQLRLSISVLFACLFYFVNSIFEDVEASDRRNIYVFKYTSDQKYSGKVDEFVDILTHKLFNLSEVSGISKETKDIISSVDLELVKSDDGIWVSNRGYSPNELMEFWRSEDALQLFFGRVFEKDSTVVARTSVHFGGLSHGLPQNGYRMEIPLTQDQYDTTRDSHSAVIMYALSLFQLGLLNDQSAVDCSEPQVSRELISLAKNYALDAAKNQQKLKEVEKAIDEVAKLFGQNCK